MFYFYLPLHDFQWVELGECYDWNQTDGQLQLGQFRFHKPFRKL